MNKTNITVVIFTIIGIIALFIFLPFLCFAGGWITGWLIKLIFGNTFCNGLALIGIHIAPSQIPLLCGIIGVIGSFFKNTINTNKKD